MLSRAQAKWDQKEPVGCPRRAWTSIQSWHWDTGPCLFRQFDFRSKDTYNCLTPSKKTVVSTWPSGPGDPYVARVVGIHWLHCAPSGC